MEMRTVPVQHQRREETGRFFAPAVTALHRDELYVLWSCARAEANLALDAWRSSPGTEAYVAYRAAEDRADAAQDALAQLV
jgi:hypothetical protein